MSKFVPVTIDATNLDDAWFLLLDYLFKYGREYKITEGSYAGQKRLTFDYVSGFVQFPHSRPLAPQIPASCTLPPPTTDHDIEQYFANYLMNSELEKNEDYRYATWIVGGWYRLPKMCGVKWPSGKEGTYIPSDKNGETWIWVPNQIQWIIDHFKEKGHGNEHCYLTVGYPESNFAYDVPYDDETGRRTSPCLRGLDFRVVDNCLLTNVIYRSWDLVGGWPTNMGGFTILNEYVADAIGVEPGPLSFSCKSLHAYDHTYEYVKARLGKK